MTGPREFRDCDRDEDGSVPCDPVDDGDGTATCSACGWTGGHAASGLRDARPSLSVSQPGWKRPMFPPLDTPSMEECARLADGTLLEQAIFELWRGRSIVSSVTGARLSREKADAILVALGEMPADHAEQSAKAEDEQW